MSNSRQSASAHAGKCTSGARGNNWGDRRVIFPWLHPSSDGDDVRVEVPVYRPRQRQPVAGSGEQSDVSDFGLQDREHPRRLLERSNSCPNDGINGINHHNREAVKLLPLPKLPDLSPLSKRSQGEKKRSRRIRDSVSLRKSSNKDSPSDDKANLKSSLLENKWVAQSPQINSLALERPTIASKYVGSHRTYYPAASVPRYHEPPASTSAAPKTLKSILRSQSSGSLGCVSRRSSILFKKPSLSPGSDPSLSPNESHVLPQSCPTLASPTSIRSLNSDHGCSENGERQHDIGETEDDLERITLPPQKVVPRQDNKLRRNASDTVVAKSEEVQQQRRRRSVHTDDIKGLKAAPVEDAVTRHHSLESLPIHKKISFDPHIWVYEYKDDRPEFERNGQGKWFTEEELDQFKADAIQRIRQRSMNMMSAGQGRIAIVPPSLDRSASPVPTTLANGSSRPVAFSHPALGVEDEFDQEASSSSLRSSSPKDNLIHDALSREMRNVLVVDPHDVFISLFVKCLKFLIPHVSIATARSGEEAMSRIQAAQKAFPVTDGGAVHGFDIIFIEEHLRPSTSPMSSREAVSQSAGEYSIQHQPNLSSGSSLIRSIVEEEKSIRERVGGVNPLRDTSIRFSLMIGVSAHLAQEEQKLRQCGADLVWGKPPPIMNAKLRNEMLRVLMKKRNNDYSSLFD